MSKEKAATKRIGIVRNTQTTMKVSEEKWNKIFKKTKDKNNENK